MKMFVTLLAAFARMSLTFPLRLIGVLAGRLSPSAASPAHNPNWLRDMPMRERLKWMFEPKTEKDRQVALTMPEIMLGLALIAVVTAGGVLAYQQVAPRVVVNNMMAGLNPFATDVAQWRELYYTQTPHGLPRGAATASESSATGWGTGTAATAQTFTCTSITTTPALCVSAGCATCTPTGVGVTTCACGAGTNPMDPNYSRLARIPSLILGDGTYDVDTDLEWHVPYGDDGVEVAFAVNPDSSTPFGTNNGDFAQCGAAANHALLLKFAVESQAICENLSVNFERYAFVSQAWCGADAALGAADGDVAMLACVTNP